MAFYYKGDLYLEKTQIVLSDEYIRTHKYNGKSIWKYAWYSNNCINEGRSSYVFYAFKNRFCDAYPLGLTYEYAQSCAPYFIIPASEIESAIESVSMPLKLTEEQKNIVLDSLMQQKNDSDNSISVVLWLIYIIAMTGSLIFNQFYILWIIFTFVFFAIKRSIIKL